MKLCGTVSLQYIPSELGFTEQAGHQTLQTLNGKVSLIAPKDTQIRDLNVSCFFTALMAPDDAENVLAILGAQGIALGLSAAGTLGGDKVLSAFNSVRKTISLAKGVFDIGSGLIASRNFVAIPVGDVNNALLIMDNVISAQRSGDPCTVIWDVEGGFANSTQARYLIKALQIRAERMDPSGNTTEFSAQITLIEAGDKLIKIS